MFWARFLILLIIRLLLFYRGQCSSQSFVGSLSDTTVLLGKSVVLPCRVTNQAGDVQWSKDGTLLGFNRTIPGFQRYFLVGEAQEGVHDLKIVNVSAEDEGDFECQVGPADGHPPLQMSAHLTVQWPATSVLIEGYDNGSTVQVQQSESITLTCEAKGGKPAPEIRWFRNSVRLRAEAAMSSTKQENGGSETAISRLTLHPLPDDNGATYTCIVHQLSSDASQLKQTIKLDVLFPPGRPAIEGFRLDDRVRAGDTLQLRCVSRGGNPRARLTWFKNNEMIDHSYVTTDWMSVNELTFEAEPSDDGARYACRANSPVTPDYMETAINLSVLYSPSSVTLTGPKEAKVGEAITMTCAADRSNPAAELTWVVDGRTWASVSRTTELVEGGGWKTAGQVIVNVTQQERTAKLFSCNAVNQALGETIVGSTSVTILHPPDPPTIFGYSEGKPIRAGTVQRLTCVSHGGNPLPTLKWFKGDKEVKEVQVTTNGNVVTGEAIIIANENDNGATYRCESSSSALDQPLAVSTTLTVYFPPATVTIKFKPKKPKAGNKVTVTCESASSNPASTVSWWRDGVEQVAGSSTAAPKSGAHGGFITKHMLQLNVTSDDDGAILICKAANDAVQHSVHDAVVLPILYKPEFLIAHPIEVEVKEGQSVVVNATARGNPLDISYAWTSVTKNESMAWEGPVLNLTDVQRSDNGNYICTATNDIGSKRIKLVLKVHYAAVLLKEEITEEESSTDESKYVVAEPQKDTELKCTAEGFPLPTDSIKWERDGYNFGEKTVISTSEIVPYRLTSILRILNVSNQDSGEFVCIVNNGIGEKDSLPLILLVKHPPHVVHDTERETVRSDRNKDVVLKCRAKGVPKVSFSWSREGAIVPESKEGTEIERVDPVTWEGSFTLKDLKAQHFGEYTCVARNELGFDTTKVYLQADGVPDPPSAVRVLNVTRNALLLAWIPGFDGGYNQTFRIRYLTSGSTIARYVDVPTENLMRAWLTGLRPNTTYQLAMMSVNEKGSSVFTTDVIKASTLSDSSVSLPPSGPPDDSVSFLDNEMMELLLSTAGVVVAFLVLLNIVLMSLYYMRKKKPFKKQRSSTFSGSTYPYDETASYFGSRKSTTVSSTISEELTLSDYSDTYQKDITTSPSRTTVATTTASSASTFDSEDVSISPSSEDEESNEDTEYSESIPTFRPYEAMKPLGSFV